MVIKLEQGFDYFLGLRALLCFVVFISHINLPLELPFASPLSFFGILSVQIFFVLSGYLIGKGFVSQKYKLEPKGLLRFWTARASRIFPLYFFLSSLFLLFYLPFYASNHNQIEIWLKILSIYTFSFDMHQEPYFTGAWWSISSEVQFYLLAPIIFLLLNIAKVKESTLTKHILVLLIISSCMLIVRYYLMQSDTFFGYNLPQLYVFLVNLEPFLVGCLGSIAVPQIVKCLDYLNSKYTNLIQFVLPLLFLAMTCTLIGFNLYANQIDKLDSSLFNSIFRVFAGFVKPTLVSYVGISMIVVLEWLYFNDWKTRIKFLTPPLQEVSVDSFFRLKAGFRCLTINWQQVIKNPWHILEIIGILSYGIYLWHGEIVYFTEKIIPITAIPSYTLNVIIAWLFTCFLATLTFYSIEKIPNYISKQFK